MVDIDGSTYLCVYVRIIRWDPYMDSLLLHVFFFDKKTTKSRIAPSESRFFGGE